MGKNKTESSMKTDNRPLIAFKDISLGYGKKCILKNLNFDILSNDFLGIIGPNGSGKTTLLKGILSLLKPVSGTITSKASHTNFGYVVQRQFVDEVFPLTAREIVSMGRYRKIKLGGRLSKMDWEYVQHAIEIAGVNSVAHQTYRSLSGGQKQRVLIARALASEANILLSDHGQEYSVGLKRVILWMGENCCTSCRVLSRCPWLSQMNCLSLICRSVCFRLPSIFHRTCQICT